MMEIDETRKPARYRSNPSKIKHYCMAKSCARWGAFGIGVSLKRDKPGKWFCSKHINAAKGMLK